MAATLPTEGQQEEQPKRSSRKQWSVHGGPRGLLRRMRSQLAEDGCPESQLVMGKTLLEQLSQEAGEGQDEEDARLAVFWLTRASHQGSVEATALLQHCLQNRIGICEHNYPEVRECLAMELQEKLARRAAHMLFNSVSNGNEFVSGRSLARKVREVLAEGDHHHQADIQSQEDEEDEGSLEERYGGERFTEDHVVSSAILYCQGRVPPLHHLLALSPAQALAPSTLWHPCKVLQCLYQASLHWLGVTLTNYGGKFLGILTPVTLTLVSCLLVGMLWAATGQHVAAVMPLVASGVSFAAMLASSARILLDRQRLSCLHAWSLVLAHFCPELDATLPEGRFRARCWRPYLVLGGAALVFLATVPLAPPKLLVALLPLMGVSSAALLLLAPQQLTSWHFISLALHMAAVTPGSLNEATSWAVEGMGLEGVRVVEVWGGVEVHFGLASLLHSLWCGLLVGVAVFQGVAGVPPHLAGVMWCHLALVVAQEVAGPLDVLYPLGAWSVLLVLPSATSLILLAVPVVVCIGLSTHLDQWMLGLASLGCAAAVWATRRWWTRVVVLVKVVLVGAMVLVFLQPSVLLPPTSGPRHSALQWDAYKNVCAPSKDMEAASIHGCAPLLGTVVRWRASVVEVKVARIDNLPRKLLSLLPTPLEEALRCYIGQRMPQCPATQSPAGQGEQRCQVVRAALGPDACTLENWDEYEFHVRVAMSASYWKFGNADSDAVLRAGDTFRDFLLGLHAGEQVEFIATLTEGVGSHHLRLELSSIRCVTCKLHSSPAQSTSVTPSRNISAAAKYVFNFFLGPTLRV